MYNSNSFIFLFLFLGPCRNASSNERTGLVIRVNGVNARLIVKGKNTFNSNGVNGINTSLNSNANFEINVESGSTLTTCGNTVFDIYGSVGTSSALDFSGTGYTCDQTKVVFGGAGTVDRPTCQACL